ISAVSGYGNWRISFDMPVSDKILKIRIWTKVIVLSALAIYTLIFLLQNSSEQVSVWLFIGVEPTTSLLVAMLGAFLLGALLTLLVRMVVSTVRQMRKAKERGRTQQLESEIRDMRTKAAQLQTRTDTPAKS
ncbi:MAG: hypothetical protein AAGK78_11425, partial [Planctomycetota bacterium]